MRERKMFAKILAFVLTVCVTLSGLPTLPVLAGEVETQADEEFLVEEKDSQESGNLVGEEIVLDAYGNIASGQSNDIYWVIDAEGTLTITGTGDWERNEYGLAPWYKYGDMNRIKKAIVDLKDVSDLSYMFYMCEEITELNLENLDTSNVTNMSHMFGFCENLITLDVGNFDTSKVTDMSAMFCFCIKIKNLDLKNFDTSNVTNMEDMFANCGALKSLDLNNFDTSKVTNMDGMFLMFGVACNDGISSLESLDLGSFDTSSVMSMRAMFDFCENLKSIDLSNFNTSKTTDMCAMFRGCKALESLDLKNFDTSNVTSMKEMFSLCKSLKSIDLSNFDTSNVTDMEEMFGSCENLKSIDLSSFDTSAVINMHDMFRYCENLENLDLSGFITSNVVDMGNIFYYCNNLNFIKTPLYCSVKNVSLPGVFIDEEGKAYNSLPENLSYSILLKRSDNSVVPSVSPSASPSPGTGSSDTPENSTIDFTYRLYNGEAYIQTFSGTGSVLEFPETIDGYTVKGIGGPTERYDFDYDGDYKNYDKYTVKKIIIPKTVRYVAKQFMVNLKGVEELVIEDGAAFSIKDENGEQIFPPAKDNPLKKIYIGSGMTGDLEYMCYGRMLETIEVSKNNPEYTSLDGILYNKDMTKLYLCRTAHKADIITIPSTVTEIGIGFNDCQNIGKIIVPSSVKTISGYAFKNCSAEIVYENETPSENEVPGEGEDEDPTPPVYPGDYDAYWGEIRPEDRPSDGKVPEGFWVAPIKDEIKYTGRPIILDLHVYCGKERLVEGIDYNVKYKNNKDLFVGNLSDSKAPSAVITGKGNFKGSRVIKFRIHGGLTVAATKTVLSKSNAKLIMYESVSYEKGGVKQKVKVYCGDRLLRYGKDYTIKYTNYANAGKAQVTVKGKGDYVGILDGSYTILAKDISKTVAFAKDKKNTGNTNYKSAITVYDTNGKKLSAGKDYDKNNIAFTYAKDTQLADGSRRTKGASVDPKDKIRSDTVIQAVIKGIGNYKGTVTATYAIGSDIFSKAKVGVASVGYTGSAVVLSGNDIVIIDKTSGRALVLDKDYVIDKTTYTAATNKGTASVLIRGKGTYEGLSRRVTFKITPKVISGTVINAGEDTNPSPSPSPSEKPSTSPEDNYTRAESIEKAQVGDIVTFGHWKEGNFDGDLEWFVMDKKKGEAILLSVGAVTYRYFGSHENYHCNVWEKCGERHWLNGEFYSTAFTEEEKSKMLLNQMIRYDSCCTNADLIIYGYFYDKVFLLSNEEIYRYFGYDKNKYEETWKEINDDSTKFDECIERWARYCYEKNPRILAKPLPHGVDESGDLERYKNYDYCKGCCSWYVREEHGAGRVVSWTGGVNIVTTSSSAGIRPAIKVAYSVKGDGSDLPFVVPDIKPLEVDLSTVKSIEDAKVGDIVIYGRYEQDNNLSNGKEPIAWYVLSKEGRKATLLSAYCLENKPYLKEYTYNPEWEDSDIRTWLNKEFYQESFSTEEQNHILEEELENNSGSNTKDKVYLFSIEEVEKYFGTEKKLWDDLENSSKMSEYDYDFACYSVDKRLCAPISKYAYETNGGAKFWSLRSTGRYRGSETILYVDENGGVNYNGQNIDKYGDHYIRPVINVSY